jgi:anti-anti-sigma factor
MKESDNLTLVVERTVVMEMEAVAVIGPFNLIDPRLIDLAADIVAEGNRRMALDFSRVSYMTSAGIACVIKILKKMQAVQGSLYIYGTSADMKDYLLLVKLDKYLQFI